MNTVSSVQKSGKITFLLNILNSIAKIAATLGMKKQIEELILLIIRGYKLYISPYKGFSCAYRKLHNQQSCSDYFYYCIIDRDLDTATVLLQQRLINCQQASKILKTTNNYQRQKPKQRRRNNHECGSCWDWIDLGFFVSDCGDCNDCDSGICDLEGCDFS